MNPLAMSARLAFLVLPFTAHAMWEWELAHGFNRLQDVWSAGPRGPGAVLAKIDPSFLSQGHNQISSDWSGFVQEHENTNQVMAGIDIPTRFDDRQKKSDVETAGEAWVGLDGYSCREGALRAGITWKHVDNNTTYVAWSQWWPMTRREFEIPVGPGEDIEFRIIAANATHGIASLINHSTKEIADQIYEDQQIPLCRRSAEWIVSRVTKPSPNDKGEAETYHFADYKILKFNKPRWTAGDALNLRSIIGAKRIRMGKLKLGFWRVAEGSSCSIRYLTKDIKCRFWEKD